MMPDCQHCGASFVQKPQTKGLFCSRACHYASEAARKPSRDCEVCGKTFRLSPRDIARDQTCCSAKCGRERYLANLSRMPIEERFWGMVNKTETCWLWTGGTDLRGYGKLFVERGKPVVSAHRFSYMLVNGSIESSDFVLHRCDIPACVRPDHLFIGDAKDNAVDCSQKDRTVFGVRQPRALLDDDKAREIYRRCASGENHSRIAQDYGVSRSAVSAIACGRVWKRATQGV